MLYPNLWFNLILAVTDNVASLKEISLSIITYQKIYFWKRDLILKWEETAKQGGNEGRKPNPEFLPGPLGILGIIKVILLRAFIMEYVLIHLFPSNTIFFKPVYCLSCKEKERATFPFQKTKMVKTILQIAFILRLQVLNLLKLFHGLFCLG